MDDNKINAEKFTLKTEESSEISDISTYGISADDKSLENSKNTGDVKVNYKREFFDWCESVIIAILIIIFIFTFVARVVDVDGKSMVPTLHHQDKIVISNLFYTPSHGDVIVLYAENLHEVSSDDGKRIVKRIIGLEGDEINIDFDNGIVYRNGTALEEDYTNTLTNEKFSVDFPVTVPEGHVFVMGDNRNFSTDSRDSRVGMVDVNSIMGKVFFRLSPVSDMGFIS